MAGGFGTRIHPLTINLPKPMIPLVNRPILGHIIELLKRHGITDLILLLYHQPEVIKKYFSDGSEFDVRIDSEQGWVQVVPDQHRPVTHIYAEAADPATAGRLCDENHARAAAWIEEMAQAG